MNERLGHLRKVNGGWALQVLERYLMQRAIGPLNDLDLGDTPIAELPIVASALSPNEPVSYSALYCSVKRWFGQAIWASDLAVQEKLDASRASLHWLRRTCGTRALERSVPLEVVQRQLGHADPRTTIRYAKPQLERPQAEMERGFG